MHRLVAAMTHCLCVPTGLHRADALHTRAGRLPGWHTHGNLMQGGVCVWVLLHWYCNSMCTIYRMMYRGATPRAGRVWLRKKDPCVDSGLSTHNLRRHYTHREHKYTHITRSGSGDSTM
jgi:alpha-D-ribose 1-methylphosphonate 5-triphosphate synthase subunit PhnL